MKSNSTPLDSSFLPPKIAEFLISPEFSDELAKIMEKHGLTETTNEPLEPTEAKACAEIIKTVSDILKGNLPYEYLEDLLKEITGLDAKTNKEIAKDLDDLIFYPFRTDLKNLYEEKQKTEFLFGSVENPIFPNTGNGKRGKKDGYRESIE